MPAALILAGLALILVAAAIAPAIASEAPGDAIAPLPDPAGGSGALDVPLVLADAPGAVDLAGQGAGLLANFSVTLAKIWQPPPAAAPYLDTINAASAANGLPDGLLARLLYQESRYRPEIIDGSKASPAGALGIAQFMPATAQQLGLDPLSPDQAIPAAAAYLRSLYDLLGSWTAALAAYNWGIGNVQRKGLAAAPAETQAYVAQISADVGLGS